MLVSAMQQIGFNKPDRFTYFVRYDPKLNPTLEALVEYDKPRSFATLWFSLENAQLSNVAAREGGRLIGSNVATRWGSFAGLSHPMIVNPG